MRNGHHSHPLDKKKLAFQGKYIPLHVFHGTGKQMGSTVMSMSEYIVFGVTVPSFNLI